jgi:REP element-mobilizing transposase RayT
MPSDLKPHRKSIRLAEYDYTQEGAYFVTICTHGRQSLFGNVIDGRMVLSEPGRIVAEEIKRTEKLRPGVVIDTYAVMPNHVHLIVVLCGENGDYSDTARRVPTGGRAFGRPQAGSLPAIIGAVKSAVTRRIGLMPGHRGGPVWQGRYYEHIIRNGASYDDIRRYILENPTNWPQDEENPMVQRHNQAGSKTFKAM